MNILKEADSLIHGDRNNSYGSYERESERIAKGWSLILGIEVKPEQVPLMMIWLKVSREAFRHKQDNLVDIAGYAGLAAELWEEPDVDDPEEYHITPQEWKRITERNKELMRKAQEAIRAKESITIQPDDGQSYVKKYAETLMNSGAVDYYDVCGPKTEELPSVIEMCPSTYQPVVDGIEYICELDAGHENDHLANTVAGKKLTWPKDFARAT